MLITKANELVITLSGNIAAINHTITVTNKNQNTEEVSNLHLINKNENENENKNENENEKKENDEEKQFIIDIDLPNIEILDVEQNKNDDYIITVQSTICGTKCGKCGLYTDNFHDSYEIKIRDLPILGHKVWIKIIRQRYKCEDCDKATTETLDWRQKRSSNTIRYEEYILRLLINSTVTDVSKKEGLTSDKIYGIMKRNLSGEVNWDELDQIPVIGIDEIANLKGHRQYLAIISARIDGEVKILAVLGDRKKKTVKNFLSNIPKRLKKTIHTVCTDMNDGYINAAKEELHDKGYQVKIVIDRFHVAKNYRKGLETIRKEEMKRLKQELSKEEYKKLKKIHWTLRKNVDKLTEKDKEKLTYLFSLSPKLKAAYDLVYELTSIFEQQITDAEGKQKMEQWAKKVKESTLTCFDKFLGTLAKYISLISNYFINRDSSGFVEGLNNKLKVIKRACYGLRNTDNFFRRIYLSLEGYRLFC